MARSYSVRFFSARGPGQLWSFEVPAGRRAVIRNFVLGSEGGSPGNVWMAIAGFYVWLAAVPAEYSSRTFDVRLTAYAGELIELYMGPALSYASVNGFLFDDTSTGLLRARAEATSIDVGASVPVPTPP